MRDRTVPRLASDVARGYACVGIALVPALAIQFLLIFTVRSIGFSTLFIVTLLIYWTITAVVFLILNQIVFGRADAAELARWLRATAPAEGRAKIWYLVNGGGAATWAITGSVVAVVAVLVLSSNERFRDEPLVLYSGIGAVVASLMLTVSAYAVRYAREYATRGGFDFPGDAEPRLVDFVYLAVQVSTTFSSSDVEIRSTSMRKIVTANSLISFAFNTVIVALLVSSLISSAS